MRNAIIIENFSLEEDFKEASKQIKKWLFTDRDEGDVLYEYKDGTLECIIKGLFEYNPIQKKYEPSLWYNQVLIKKLNLSKYLDY